MATAQQQRIVNLAYAGHSPGELAMIFGLTEASVIATIADTTIAPTAPGTSLSSLSVGGTTIDGSGNTDVVGTFGVDGVATFDGVVSVGGELQGQTAELEHGFGVFGTEPPGAAAAITGALSTVADAPAKAVLTSIIAALVATGQATNGTT